MAKKIVHKHSAVKKEGKPLIPERYQDYTLIAILIISVFVFLSSGIFGGGFNAGDTIASDSFKTFLSDAKASGNFPLWIPNIFSGMPAYSSLLLTGERVWDFAPKIVFGITILIGDIFGNDSARVASFYAIYAVGMYLLMRSKSLERFPSFFGAFAATFSTSVIIWIMIGHNTKPIVISILPFIFLLLEKLREKFSLLHSVFLMIAIHLMLEGAHLQMIFYSVCAIGLYFVFELVSRLISKDDVKGILRAGGILAVAGLFAFLMSSDRYLAARDYTPYSTRGSAPIAKESNHPVDAKGGNTYEYATMWSFSPAEMATFFIPNYYGFGKMKYDPEKYPEYRDLGAQANYYGGRLHSYWSQKPMEDAAPYMGILVLVFGLIGILLNWKNIFVQILTVLSAFSLLLSFGYTFPILYDIFFKFVPAFNKFRAPSMALILIQFSFPILAAFGLSSIMKLRQKLTEKNIKIIYGLLGFSGIFLLFGLIYGAAFQGNYFSAIGASKFASQIPQEIRNEFLPQMQGFIWSEMISDWYATAIILLFASILVYLYVKGFISNNITTFALAILLVFDMWRVGFRPMDTTDKPLKEQVFQENDAFEFIQKDKEVFRIADFSSQSPNVAAYYRMQNVNGYHSAKLRVYQDLLDVASEGSTNEVSNPFLWSLMNVKYLLSTRAMGSEPVYKSPTNGTMVYLNPRYMQRATFVKRAEVAKPIDILNKMKYEPTNPNFNPFEVAFFEKLLPIAIDSNLEGTSAKVTKFENELIEIEATATGNNLLYVSEVYYPIGWKATIDGKETEIFKTNYAFRSIIVPKGKHRIEFKFTDKSFELGKNLSTGANIFMVIILGFALYSSKKNKSIAIEPKNKIEV
jgi:hypothetical protein